MTSHRARRILLAAAAVAAAAGCSSSPPQPAARADGSWDTSLHVHALAVNPGEDDAVYAATHTGVWRLPLDASGRSPSGPPTRIAERWQDTMSFAIPAPDVFLASGHPDPRTDAPPLLGLVRSTDQARTWQPVSLAGVADFHDLEPTSGERIYGYDATSGQVLRSDDTGKTWQATTSGGFRDLAVDPARPDTVLATSEDGLLLSRDGARSFTPVPDAPALLLVDLADGALVGATPDGAVWAASWSDGTARGWSSPGRLAGSPAALTAVTSTRLLAADPEGVAQSADGGRSWTRLTSSSGSTEEQEEEGHTH